MQGVLKFIGTVMEMCILMALSFTFIKNALHMFQQNRYELYRYSKWLFNKKNIHFTYSIIFCVLIAVLGIIFRKGFGIFVVLLVDVLYAIYLLYKETNRHYIKDLVLTARVKRQIVVFAILMIIFTVAVLNLLPLWADSILMIVAPYLLVYVMGAITQPIEERIKKGFENEAREILDTNPGLIKIGITGSYGKTSTKNIITDIISELFFPYFCRDTGEVTRGLAGGRGETAA